MYSPAVRVRVIFPIALLAASASGCAWCVDQCLGVPQRERREAPRREPDPCDLLPGARYRAADGRSLRFFADTVEWRHDGVSELFEFRCRDSALQFRDPARELASDAVLRGYETIEWNGVAYTLERRR